MSGCSDKIAFMKIVEIINYDGGHEAAIMNIMGTNNDGTHDVSNHPPNLHWQVPEVIRQE